MRFVPAVSLAKRPLPTKKDLMKVLERITLISVTTVYAGYLVKEAIRTRAERLFRLAAGESPYERTHPKPRALKHS